MADTPIAFAQQVIEDAGVALENKVLLSEPQRRQLGLARAYLERVEELRLARNMVRALEIDLAIYKKIAGAA